MVGGFEGVDDLLVVEDNPGDVRFIEVAVQESELGSTIHTASTVAEALDYIHQREDYATAPRPDVVLLGWHLTQNTSKDVLEAAKSIDSSIPVVVMTGSTAEVEKLAGSIPHADVCIEKQTEPEGYIEALRSLLTEQ